MAETEKLPQEQVVEPEDETPNLSVSEAVDLYRTKRADTTHLGEDLLGLLTYLDAVMYKLKQDPLGAKLLAKVEAELDFEYAADSAADNNKELETSDEVEPNK